MTQSTLELIAAHTEEYEFEETRSHKRVPRPYRHRTTSGRRRRTAKLTINGRNTSRSTVAHAQLSKLSMKLQSGNI